MSKSSSFTTSTVAALQAQYDEMRKQIGIIESLAGRTCTIRDNLCSAFMDDTPVGFDLRDSDRDRILDEHRQRTEHRMEEIRLTLARHSVYLDDMSNADHIAEANRPYRLAEAQVEDLALLIADEDRLKTDVVTHKLRDDLARLGGYDIAAIVQCLSVHGFSVDWALDRIRDLLRETHAKQPDRSPATPEGNIEEIARCLTAEYSDGSVAEEQRDWALDQIAKLNARDTVSVVSFIAANALMGTPNDAAWALDLLSERLPE
jgi:hypothetical protein